MSGAGFERALGEALGELLEIPPPRLVPVAGGDINAAYRAEPESGESLFVKARPGAAPGEFAAEAAGLRWLGEGGEVLVPEVVAVGTGERGRPPLLALEWVPPGVLGEAGAEQLGRGLAAMHRLGAPEHGWLPGGLDEQRLGTVELPTRPGEGWPRFYAEQRLAPLARMAAATGNLDPGGETAIATVCERIAALAGPVEPPARLHGDLWGGNVLAGADGRARLIDPAAQGGHRELDLAMLRLFGSPSERIFAAYEEVAPLAPGHADRVALWQLQPLLVHAVLFGGGYGRSARRAAESLL